MEETYFSCISFGSFRHGRRYLFSPAVLTFAYRRVLYYIIGMIGSFMQYFIYQNHPGLE